MLNFIRDKWRRFKKFIIAFFIGGIVLAVSSALVPMGTPPFDEIRNFTTVEQEIILRSLDISFITNVSPNHRAIMQEIINESVLGKVPSTNKFSDTDVNIREAYKDLLEILGDSRNSDEDFNASFEVLNSRVREYMFKSIEL